MRDILASFDRENVGWKMMYNFLGNDEKTCSNIYLLSLKTSTWKRSQTFFPCSVSKIKPRDYPP